MIMSYGGGGRRLMATPVASSSSSSRFFASTSFLAAKVASSSSDFTFPTKRHPTPFEIFHFPIDAALTASLVKSRYYDLCRLYHPDMKASSSAAASSSSSSAAGDTSKEFKAIVEAYELLRSPSRRSVYLRSGYGWTTRGPASRSNAGYDFSRGRPMPAGGPGANRGPYPSAAYDTWTDPFNPHFRPEYGGGGVGTQTRAGWGSSGYVGSNGAVFLGLLGLTVVITPLSFYSLVPPSSLLPSDSRYSDPSWGGLSNGRDDRHNAAARALTQARKEARNGGDQKREALKRRVRQIEAEKAYDRAVEVQRISRGRKETGHLLSDDSDISTESVIESNGRGRI